MKNYMNFYERVEHEEIGTVTEEKVWRTAECVNAVPLEFGGEIIYDNLDDEIKCVNGEYSFERYSYDAEKDRFEYVHRNGYLGSSVFNNDEGWLTVEQASAVYDKYYSGYEFEES